MSSNAALDYAQSDDMKPAKSPQKGRKTGNKKSHNKLGRLSSLGLAELWQVSLLLPNSWQNFSAVYSSFDRISSESEGAYVAIRGHLTSDPDVRFNGTPRMVGYIHDNKGNTIGFSQFGDTKELQKKILNDKKDLLLFGQLRLFNGKYWIQNIEVVPKTWVGRMRPVYPGKTKVITPQTVRAKVFANLKASIPYAAKWITHELARFGDESRLKKMCGCPDEWSIEQMLTYCHLPKSVNDGKKAQQCLEILAGLGAIQKAWEHKKVSVSCPLKMTDWQKRSQGLPFTLTGEQKTAVDEIVADLQKKAPMHRLLIGDVGTGKTAVYALAAASCVDGGNRVVVMLPNTPLATQIADDFRMWWPDMKVQLVTGESEDEDIDQNCPVTVGTTALFRLNKTPDFVIVDEQQKFSREQREQLLGAGANLLEVSATCIPRSQALARYGVLKVSTLKTCHVKKKIHTRIWDHSRRSGLFENVKNTLAKNKQVLVVYPKKEAGENEAGQEDKHSVEEAYKAWNKLFPGRVRFSHGGLSDEEKSRAIKDMVEEKADILVATTVAEIGINIPNLYHEIIVHPDRLGLSTLHQLRGRVARSGGAGWCDLYLPKPVKEQTMERLKVLANQEDGFKIAEEDMRLRGMGDLGRNSGKQTGADDTFIFGRPVDMRILDYLLRKLTGDVLPPLNR